MNFLLGGRMGDLIHALWVAKNTKGKHDLFITDRRDLHSDGFVLPLAETINELWPVLMSQPWCGTLNSYNDEKPIENLSMWRRYVYSAPWTQLLSNTFGPAPNGEPWITLPKINGWENKTVIHRSLPEPRNGTHWNIVKDNYGHNAVFVGNPEEYKAFEFELPFYQPKDLLDHFNVINSCGFFIGNQSAPLAMAHALGVPRLAMLNEVDKIAYVGEEKWHKGFYWIAKDDHNFFEGLSYM